MSGAGELRLGFVPLNDAAPLIVALERGFFRQEGVRVSLHREVSWATVRDKVAAGAFEAAHMLAPITLASTLGAGGEAEPMIAPLALNRNGAAVTLARRLGLPQDADPAAMAGGLARLVAQRRAAREPALTLAVVFPYSMHNYVLRYWLAEAGVDPDRDVRITVAPPSRMASRLEAGELDGFCAGEPWNAVAEAEGVGQVAVRASQIWRGGPEKVLGVKAEWAARHPELLQALLRAVLRAAAWADAPDNRGELAALLARPEYVDAPTPVIERSLTDIVFHRDEANAPLPVHAAWLLSQMMRWGQIDPVIGIAGVVSRVYRFDLYEQAATAVGLGVRAPAEAASGFADGRTFELAAARAYAESFPMGRIARP